MCRFFPEFTERTERNLYKSAAFIFIMLPLAILTWDREINQDKDKMNLTLLLSWFSFSCITFGLGYKIRDMLPENEPSFLPRNNI